MRLAIQHATPEHHALDEEAPNVIGRREGAATIVVAGSTLARAHFQLIAEGGRWWLEDLNSPGGTYKNDQLARGRVEVRAGDELRAGQVTFVLVA